MKLTLGGAFAAIAHAATIVACAGGEARGPTDVTVPMSSASTAKSDTMATARGRLDAAIAQICPPAEGDEPPGVLSEGGQMVIDWEVRTVAVVSAEVAELEANLTPIETRAFADDEFKIAMDYYELEAAAYQECRAAAVTPSTIAQADVQAATAVARGRIMANAAARGKKACAALHEGHYLLTGPCP